MGFRSKRDFRTVLKAAGDRLNPRKEMSKIGFSWMKENLNFSFLSFIVFK
jgi:hypothetical protein